MQRTVHRAPYTRAPLALALSAFVAVAGCADQEPTGTQPLLPPEPPDNPEILSAAWTMDVNRATGEVRITPPEHGVEGPSQQILADYFDLEPGGPNLSIIAGDVVEIIADSASFATSELGEFLPNLLRTTFDVQIRNKLSGVNLTTPSFPTPPEGTDGIVLFPFEIVVTETPGGVSGGQGDGTEVLIELPNGGEVAPSTDWDEEPFNFFNDEACDPEATDCYRSEVFPQPLQASSTSPASTVGFDLEPTVSQFRVRMIVAADLADADTTANTPPTADAGGPYEGAIGDTITLAGSATDPDGDEIVRYDWDFNDDGVFDDASGADAQFVCTEEGTFPIALEVEDERGGTGTASSEVVCGEMVEGPVADAGGPYQGDVGGSVDLDGTGSTGNIALYEWELTGDGAFDDATGETASFACTEEGTFDVELRVTDDADNTDTDATTVECVPAQEVDGVVNARWVDADGNPVESVDAGGQVFLQMDVDMGANTIDAIQMYLNYDTGLLLATAASDLACDDGDDCPSGTSSTPDVMNQFTGNVTNPGTAIILNLSIAGGGEGIQGLTTIDFDAVEAGEASPTLEIDIAATDGGATPVALSANIPSLTIN